MTLSWRHDLEADSLGRTYFLQSQHQLRLVMGIFTFPTHTASLLHAKQTMPALMYGGCCTLLISIVLQIS